MAAEFYIRFRDPAWYTTNRTSLEAQIQRMPIYVAHFGNEFRLRGTENPDPQEFHVRLFLEPDYILLEISVHPHSIEAGLEKLLNWIRKQTPIRIEDEDGEPCNW